MPKSPRKVTADIPVKFDDDIVLVTVTAMVTPFRPSTLTDPSCGWTVEILSMVGEDDGPVSDELWHLAEKAVDRDPSEMIGAWLDENDRDADDAADLRRNERWA